MKTYSRKKAGEKEEVIIDLDDLCRLCMSKEDDLVPIFNTDDPVPLTLRIMACVALEVSIVNSFIDYIYPFVDAYNLLSKTKLSNHCFFFAVQNSTYHIFI